MSTRVLAHRRWTISVPVWGDVYFETFRRVGAPALLAAARGLADRGERARFVVHTDRPYEAMADVLRWPGQPQTVFPLELRPVSPRSPYVTLQESHADAVALAAPGERVVLLNADLVVSGNLLERCAQHFDAGHHAVVLLGIRTAAGPRPPLYAPPRELLAWAWDHRHQIIRDLEWPSGGSLLPTNLFWSSGGSVVARGFHLHPVAIVKQPDTTFRSTIDGDLLECFDRERIHVVVDPDDCSMCEVSPANRRFPVRGNTMTPARIAASMRTRASELHRWLFGHRIVVCGSGDDVADDAAVARDVLREMARLGTMPFRRTTRGRTPGGRRGRPRAEVPVG